MSEQAKLPTDYERDFNEIADEFPREYRQAIQAVLQKYRDECAEANREIERQGFKLARQMTERAELVAALRHTAGYRGTCCGRAKEPMWCMHDNARAALARAHQGEGTP